MEEKINNSNKGEICKKINIPELKNTISEVKI